MATSLSSDRPLAADSGETFVARRAGTTAAATVTATPVIRQARAVRGRNTTEAGGRSNPVAAMTASRPRAASTPRTMPAAEATSPTTMASASTEAMRW